MKDKKASFCFCWRNGRIEFGKACPNNAIQIATGPIKQVREIVEVLARHAYPKTRGGPTPYLLVPGIPEAETDGQALEAVIDFTRRVKSALDRNK